MFVMKSLVFTQGKAAHASAGRGWPPPAACRRLHTALPFSGAYFRPFRGERPHRGEHMPTSNTSWMALRKQWKLYSIKPTEKNPKTTSVKQPKCGSRQPDGDWISESIAPLQVAMEMKKLWRVVSVSIPAAAASAGLSRFHVS